jgi:hypothetical protein
MGGCPGGELQGVHPLPLSCAFPIPVAVLGLLFIERQPLQGKKWSDHALSHPPGFVPGLGPYQTVDVKRNETGKPAKGFIYAGRRKNKY